MTWWMNATFKLLNVYRYKYIFVDLGSVSFSWVYREANLAAYELARWFCSHSHFCGFVLVTTVLVL